MRYVSLNLVAVCWSVLRESLSPSWTKNSAGMYVWIFAWMLLVNSSGQVVWQQFSVCNDALRSNQKHWTKIASYCQKEWWRHVKLSISLPTSFCWDAESFKRIGCSNTNEETQEIALRFHALLSCTCRIWSSLHFGQQVPTSNSIRRVLCQKEVRKVKKKHFLCPPKEQPILILYQRRLSFSHRKYCSGWGLKTSWEQMVSFNCGVNRDEVDKGDLKLSAALYSSLRL